MRSIFPAVIHMPLPTPSGTRRNHTLSIFPDNLKFDTAGLITAVIQDTDNGDVLMVGYMDREAIARTISTRQVTFWSRSRREYWVKGESSGNTQELDRMLVDCDLDCLLVKVRQTGPACHEGYRSCFFRAVSGSDGSMEIVADRWRAPEEMYGSASK